MPGLGMLVDFAFSGLLVFSLTNGALSLDILQEPTLTSKVKLRDVIQRHTMATWVPSPTKYESPPGVRIPRCFQNTTIEDCKFLLSAFSREVVREDNNAHLLGRERRRLLKSWVPTNLWEPPSRWERLSRDCEEPEDPPRAIAGGPDQIYCCHTAQAIVTDLEEKYDHCNSDPPVDCWKSLRIILPVYLRHYRGRRDQLCMTTTTSTTTTSTFTTTSPPTTTSTPREPCRSFSSENQCPSRCVWHDGSCELPPPEKGFDEEYWKDNYNELASDSRAPCTQFPKKASLCPSRCIWDGKECQMAEPPTKYDEQWWKDHYMNHALSDLACSKFPPVEKYCPERCRWTGEACKNKKKSRDMHWCYEMCQQKFKIAAGDCDAMCEEVDKRMEQEQLESCEA